MEYSALVQQIVDKGKRGAAEYIKTSRSPDCLDLVLDRFLNHETPIDDNESIEWIKWLIAGGETPDDFTAIVKKYNNATTCGLVWTAQFVAYRCRTCGISPCMSLCADCFLKGQHEGHDFNMFRSQAGGACDCGDTSVMRSTGFCDRHGVVDNSESMIPPPDLLYIAELMAPRIFFRLILHLRNFKRSVSSSRNESTFDADDFLSMLSDFSGMGAAMRRVLTSALINPQVYQKLTREWPKDDSPYAVFMNNSKALYEDALISLRNPDPPPEFEDCTGLQKELKHETFLEELVFWTVKYEFPQKVVCFLLNMLPDVKYKEALTEAFVIHYSRIAMVLEKAADPDTLSNRVVHVSVQLFSNEELAVRMTENFCLLQVMVVSLKNMMSRILIPMPLTFRSTFSKRPRPRVVNCAQPVMNQHCYWPLVSDLNNVLSHRPVAIKFMDNDMLTNMWFSFLSYFQGMNVNQREMNQHVEFEPGTYYAAFSAELEASAYPMWALLSHLNNKSSIPYTKRMLRSCITALEEWLQAVIDPSAYDENQVSFHIPLHRYLATFICQAVNVQQLSLEDVLPRNQLIESILLHPLRIQVAFYEIVNGLWVRNGLQIKGQAMTYIQCNFCSSMVDADLYLLQILSTQLSATRFMQLVIEKFHVSDWLSFFNNIDRTNISNECENDTPMLESFLQFIATLCSNRTNLGIEYYGAGPTYPVLTRLEMITLLCVADRTHSQLMELMPERCGSGQSRDFDPILGQVADYRPPNFEVSGNMQQGLYIPKACVWEELYDPIHVLLRAVQNKKDFQNSTDRFTAFVKQSNLLPPGTIPWPPFRIPKPCSSAYKDPRSILNTSVFHAVVWIVFYKYVHEKSVTEHVLSLAVYLLEIALSIAPKMSNFISVGSRDPPKVDVTNLKLETWFPSNHLSANVRTIIRTIVINAGALEWKPLPDSYDLCAPSQSSLRHMLESGPFSNSCTADPVPSATSTSLVPAHASDRSVLISPSSPSRYAIDRNSQPSSSSSTSSNVSNELPHYVQCFPSVLPLITRKLNSQSWKTNPVAVGSSTDMKLFGSPVPDMKIFNANESIISLLLRIHSKLSGYPDSFNPESVKPEELDVRIGDGAAFVGKVLTRIMMMDETSRCEVLACRERLWPKQQYKIDTEQKDTDGNKLSDKKRIALERQRKMMESFAFQREEFAKKNLDVSGEDNMDWEGSDTTETHAEVTQKQYDCGICSQTSPSTDQNPIGLVILVQATSVLGHKRKYPERAVLPTSDKDRVNLFASDTMSSDFQKKVDNLNREFNQQSWQQSISFGWEGGIHVQTCGHHLHLNCLLRYLNSLRGQQRLFSDSCIVTSCMRLLTESQPVIKNLVSTEDQTDDNVEPSDLDPPSPPPDDSRFHHFTITSTERGEYLCPMCRQVANSVLPVPPNASNVVASYRQNNIFKAIADIANLLHNAEPKNEDQKKSELTTAIERSVDDMKANFFPKQHITEIFVTSVARTNLEIDIVQRGGSLLKSVMPTASSSTPRENLPSIIAKKSSCILPLLHVLATHARKLDRSPVARTWEQLTGMIFVGPSTCGAVPLLLRDPVALLIQFVLLLPLNMDETYFTCIVKFLYNLLYFQVVAQLSCHLKEAERNYFRAADVDMSNNIRERFSLDHAMKYTIESMDKTLLYLEDGNYSSLEQEPAYETLELKIQEMCLPFLRVASVLRHHMYNEELPEVLVEADEFVRLVYYLELVSHGMDRAKFNSAVVFTWKDDKLDFVESWFEEFRGYAERSQISARNFLSELHIPWKQPRLLQLPYQYDKIFQYYQRKACSYCNQIPNEGSICLVCGTLVCFKQSCCKREKIHEATQHANDCGAGTAMFLVVTSSCVIVVRGKRACVWGSVYLDVFGEEDRDLKRGKPLYLSVERYKLLERQWLTHSFDHTSKKWVLHGDGL